MGFWWMILWKWGRIHAGNFIRHKIKIVTEINILEQNKEVAEIILAKEMGTESVF